MSDRQMMETLDRTKTQLANLKKKANLATERIVMAGATLAGAAAAGYSDRKWPTKDLLGISYPVAFGTALGIVGLAELAGEQSEMVGHLGLGMLCAEAYKFTLARTKAGTQGDEFGALPMPSHEELMRGFHAVRSRSR